MPANFDQANSIKRKKIIERVNSVLVCLTEGGVDNIEGIMKLLGAGRSTVGCYLKILKRLGRIDNNWKVMNQTPVSLNDNIQTPYQSQQSMAKAKAKRVILRKERYRTDKKYRNKVKADARNRYRAKAKAKANVNKNVVEAILPKPIIVPLQNYEVKSKHESSIGITMTPEQLASFARSLMEVVNERGN